MAKFSEAAGSRKRGRPPSESPHEKLARLERELTAARAAVREAEQRKFTLIGEALAAEAEENPALRAQLVEILAKRITSAAGRAEIAPLFLVPHGRNSRQPIEQLEGAAA